MIKARARCASCGEIFASDAEPEQPVRCPACGFEGPTGGVMRVGPPSLESFTRNWQRAHAHARTEDESE